MTDEAIFDQEWAKPAQLIERVTGHKPTMYRPPYRHIAPHTEKYFTDHGVIVVKWSIDSLDATTVPCAEGDPGCNKKGRRIKNADELFGRVTSEVQSWAMKDGNIVLFHSAPGHGHSVEALTRLLPWFQNGGYRFLPLCATIPGTNCPPVPAMPIVAPPPVPPVVIPSAPTDGGTSPPTDLAPRVPVLVPIPARGEGEEEAAAVSG